MHSLICAFVVAMQHSQVFSYQGPPVNDYTYTYLEIHTCHQDSHDPASLYTVDARPDVPSYLAGGAVRSGS